MQAGPGSTALPAAMAGWAATALAATSSFAGSAAGGMLDQRCCEHQCPRRRWRGGAGGTGSTGTGGAGGAGGVGRGGFVQTGTLSADLAPSTAAAPPTRRCRSTLERLRRHWRRWRYGRDGRWRRRRRWRRVWRSSNFLVEACSSRPTRCRFSPAPWEAMAERDRPKAMAAMPPPAPLRSNRKTGSTIPTQRGTLMPIPSSAAPLRWREPAGRHQHGHRRKLFPRLERRCDHWIGVDHPGRHASTRRRSKPGFGPRRHRDDRHFTFTTTGELALDASNGCDAVRQQHRVRGSIARHRYLRTGYRRTDRPGSYRSRDVRHLDRRRLRHQRQSYFGQRPGDQRAGKHHCRQYRRGRPGPAGRAWRLDDRWRHYCGRIGRPVCECGCHHGRHRHGQLDQYPGEYRRHRHGRPAGAERRRFAGSRGYRVRRCQRLHRQHCRRWLDRRRQYRQRVRHHGSRWSRHRPARPVCGRDHVEGFIEGNVDLAAGGGINTGVIDAFGSVLADAGGGISTGAIDAINFVQLLGRREYLHRGDQRGRIHRHLHHRRRHLRQAT